MGIALGKKCDGCPIDLFVGPTGPVPGPALAATGFGDQHPGEALPAAVRTIAASPGPARPQTLVQAAMHTVVLDLPMVPLGDTGQAQGDALAKKAPPFPE
mgnify:CR=1 FL=1